MNVEGLIPATRGEQTPFELFGTGDSLAQNGRDARIHVPKVGIGPNRSRYQHERQNRRQSY